VQTGVYDGDNRVETIVNTYEKEEYNKWWEEFNSGKAVMEKVIEINNLDVIIPKNIEQDFINEITIETNEQQIDTMV